MYLPDVTTHLLYLSSNPFLGPSRFLQRPRSDGCMNSRYRCEQQTGQLEAFKRAESTNLARIRVLQPFRRFFLSKHLPDGKILANQFQSQHISMQVETSCPLTYICAAARVFDYQCDYDRNAAGQVTQRLPSGCKPCQKRFSALHEGVGHRLRQIAVPE